MEINKTCRLLSCTHRFTYFPAFICMAPNKSNKKCHLHICCIFQRVSALIQSFGSFKTNRLLCTSCITFDPTLTPSFIFCLHSSFPLCSSPYCLNAKAHSTMSHCLSCIDLFVLIASHKTLRIFFPQLLSQLSQCSKCFR